MKEDLEEQEEDVWIKIFSSASSLKIPKNVKIKIFKEFALSVEVKYVFPDNRSHDTLKLVLILLRKV